MRRDKDIRQIVLQVSIALSAGVFSITPTVSAATPELDGKPAAAITVDQTTSPQVTDISSTVENNVINWKNFSVPQGETVRFDGGAHTNNYLNVVTGENVSQIDGSIQGGKNVYIVNPNGVVFGESASVDVGALYVSTRNIDDTVKANFADGKGIDLKPLKDTSALPSNDIVNMGTVQANTVFLEGGNIVIGEVNKIKTADGLAVNNNVTIQTKGNVTLGRSVSSIVAEKNANDISEAKLAKKATDIDASLADSGSKNSAGYTFTLNNTATVLPLIYSEADLMAVSSDCVGKAKSYTYTLKADLDFSKSGAPSFSPISNFKSTFDGEFHTISGIKVTGGTYGGLFGAVSNAVIKNVGVVGADITANNAGGIAGHASNTTFTNVFNESSKKIKGTTTSYYAGGIVGYATNCTITTAYNTGTVIGEKNAGGIAGYVDATTITHVYNTGNASFSFVGRSSNNATVYDGYTTSGSLDNTYYKGTMTNILSSPTSHYEADYKSKLSSISNKGGENTTWRIYEGQSLPLLRAFLTGHGTVNVNYHYAQGTNSGDLAGSDLSTTYNGSDVVLSGINYTKDGGAFTPTAKIITAPTDNTIDGDITSTNYDTVNKKVRTLAAFYTGQQGYDLVGNNYTINQKSVTIDSSTVKTAPYSREYNGTNDATDAIKNFSYGGANGIVDGDIAAGKVSIDTSGVNAYFVGTGGKITDEDAPDVGLGDKTIALTGGVTVQNGTGYYNYILTGSASFGDASNPTTFGGNSITPKKITVNLTNPTGIKKQYDGGTDVKGDAYLPGAQFVSQAVNYTVSGAQKTEKVNFNTNGITANYVDDDDNPVATAGTYDKKVKYSGIAIASVDNGKVTNYELVDAQGNTIYFKDKNEVKGTGSLYGSGKISRIKLDNTGFSWYKGTDAQPATREYDKTSAYKEPVGSGDTAYTVDSAQTAAIQDDLTFTVTGANFLKTINATDLAVNAGEAHYVGYTVAVSGDAAVNYTFGDNDEPIGSSITLFGEGSITPRTIKLDVASGRSADKMYDAGTAVLDNADKSSFTISEDSTVNSGFNDGTDTYHLLEYTGGDDYKLLDDGAKIVYSGAYKQKGTEGNANVYFVNDQVASKNITYTANIENANGNYVFDNGTTSKTFDNGVGKITQREISNLYFTDVNKTYDTTAAVDHDDIAVDVGDGVGQVKLYGSDTAATVFDMSKVNGVYVHKDASKKDEDVEDGGKAKSKNVTYTLQDDFLTNHNYKLSDSIGTTVNGEGAILPITLNDRSKLTLDVSGVTKVYDGDTNIKGPHASSTDNDNMAFIGTKGLVYALDDNPDHDIKLNIDSVHAAYYDSADSNNATPQGITYELAVSGDSSGNYTIANTLLTGDYLKWNKDVTGWSDAEKAKMTGVITKRDLIVTPLHDPVTKVYDGNTTVKDGTTTLVNDTAVSFDGWINVDGRTKTATANYTDKNVDSAAETAAGGKTVNYVIGFGDGDSAIASQGNYTLYTLKDDQKIELTNNTLTGKGHITPATLHIEFAEKHKIYDGNDSYTGAVSPTYTGRITGDKVELDDTVYAAKFNSSNVADADTITYTIVLKGDDKGNYIIDPTNSTTVGGVTTIDGEGYIEALGINSATVDYNPINKVYDATNSVTYDHTGDNRYFDGEKNKADAKDYINSITLGTNVVLVKGTDYTIKSAVYDKADKGNRTATYVFQLSDDVAANYNLSMAGYSATDKSYTWTATENVSITPKQLQASLNDTELNLERVYNGTTNLPVTTAQAASKVTVTGVVNDNGDTTAFDGSLVNGRYVDRNVAYDTDGNVTTKDVLFDVNLKGTGAENYVINNTNANSTTLIGANLGKITPKELTVDFVYTEKTYNNSPNATVTGVNLTGLQTGDDGLNLHTGTIVAQFGSKSGDTFTANGDVNYDANAEGKAGFKGVQYSNLQEAMETGFGEDNGYKIAKNYTIADTVYFAEAAKMGKIKRLALTLSDIEAGFKGDITKPYDGSSTVLEPEKYFSVHTKKEKTDGVEVEFKLRHDEDWAYYVDANNEKQVNVVDGSTLTYNNVVYKINGLDADDILHNYDITGLTENSFSGTYSTQGDITPRVLKIDVTTPNNWVKTYDGTTDIKDANGAVVNNFDFTYQTDHNILKDDANTVKLAVTGAYGDSDANVASDSTDTNGKVIKYTLKLTGNTAGNYTLDSTAHPNAGAETETDSTTYTGDGAIKRRIVYAAFDDGYGTGIDRDYAGANDTSADADKSVRTHINLVASSGGNTGLLDKDSAVTLDKDNISANYASANVARNPQTKKVTTQDVYFTNFNLQGTGSGNYEVKVNDANNPNTLVGEGTIKPIKVTVGLENVPTKEYDGTADIKATYLANDNFTFTPAPSIASENVANDIAITGAYKNANAGSKDANYADKEYTYSLTLNNDNYELMSGDDNGRTVTATNYGTKATLAGTDGIIEARTISLASIADMTKVYDGTTDADTGYMNNLEKNITFNNVVNNESLKLTGTAVYNDDANASDVETTAKPKKHQVKYTVNIGNTNYRLDDGTQYGTQELTGYGDGYINRRTLSLVATPTSVNVGESMPAFTGTVTGFAGNEATLYSDFISYVKDNFKAADGANTSTPGSYGVYGWYMGNKTGLLGLNYQFDQAPANATAFTVNYVNNNTGNPDTKITPNNSIYHQISKDMNSGFGDTGAAAIEYKDKSGKVLGTEKIDSGEINGKGLMIGGGADMSKQADSNANIGIAGGDIVNMEGANAAGSVNIETNGEGTVVNLEVFSIDEEKKSGTNNSTAEITNMDSQNGMASIEIRDEKQNIIGEDVRDKKEEKEGQIAIESSNGENEDEIELTVEKQGVNVA